MIDYDNSGKYQRKQIVELISLKRYWANLK